MASVYVMGQLPIKIFNKEVDYEADTIKLMLLSSSATPNVDTHVYLADVEGDEVSGTGYVASGETLTGKTISYNSGTDTTSFDADDITWEGLEITARYGVIYDATGDSSTSPIIAYMDFGSELSLIGEFSIKFSDSGIFTIANGFEGILDTLNIVNEAVLVFTPYKRSTNTYIGNKLLLQRSSDLATLYVTTDDYDNEGNIKQSVVTNFAGAGDCVVREVYLETGGVKAYQGTYANCPFVVISGVFQTNGLKFDGSNDTLTVDEYSAINITSRPFTLYSNNIPTGYNSMVFAKCSGTGYSSCQYAQMYTDSFWFFAGSNSSNILSIGANKDSLNQSIMVYRANDDVYAKNTNKSEVHTTASRTITQESGFHIADLNGSSSLKFEGYIKSILVFNTDVYSQYDSLVAANI